MAPSRQILTISLPRQDAKRLDKVAKQSGLSRSHFVRDALKQATLLRDFEKATHVGEQIAREMNIETYEDVERIFGRHS